MIYTLAHNWYRHLTEDQDQPPQPHRPIYKPMHRGGRARRGLTVVENTYHEQERYEANFAVLKIDYANHAPMLPLYKWPGSRKCYLVLHLFSGRRREGDLHDHLQRMAQGKDYDIKVFSMDLAVDEHYGDLSPTSATWLKVKEGLTKGIFAAGLAGSPCNTYSEARYHQPEDTSRKWPRPVRTRAEPMGTPPPHRSRTTTCQDGNSLRYGSHVDFRHDVPDRWNFPVGAPMDPE